MTEVFLDGVFVPVGQASLALEDRGFMFGDGAYEVVRVYAGRPFLLEEHLARLERSLGALRISTAGVPELGPACRELLGRNRLQEAEATLYLQVTRGVAPRSHAFPVPPVPPTVVASARPFRAPAESSYREGVAAITVEDTRWAWCDVKSVNLVPNVLGCQRAREAGAFEALFRKGGVVLEGTHTNLFARFGGTLVTAPARRWILAGITRARILELAAEAGVAVEEEAVEEERLAAAEEIFLTGTTTEVMPVTTLNGRPVGEGRPGAAARELLAAYRSTLPPG
jgi:D-alanine transaminase